MHFSSIWLTFRHLRFGMSQSKFLSLLSGLHRTHRLGPCCMSPARSSRSPSTLPCSQSATLSCRHALSNDSWLLPPRQGPLRSSLHHFSHANPIRPPPLAHRSAQPGWHSWSVLICSQPAFAHPHLVHTKSFHLPRPPWTGPPCLPGCAGADSPFRTEMLPLGVFPDSTS